MRIESRNNGMTRRDLIAIASSAVTATALGAAPGDDAALRPLTSATPAASHAAPPTLTIFSRHLNWAGVDEAIEVAARAGFGGIAWTVRTGAHILPQNVERDLPRVVELTRRAGLAAPHIVTALNDAGSPYAEAIVATAASVGIHLYRMQTARYDYAADVPAQLEALRPRVAGLAQLNERYGSTALIHTHGSLVAGAVWDTWLLLRDIDPDRVAINFDTGYAMVQTGRGWMEAVRFARRHIRMLSLKDFRWQRRVVQSRVQWDAEICQPGQGMVDFPAMLGYFHATGFSGTAEVQFEYPIQVAGRAAPISLMAADVGQWQLEMPKAEFTALLKRDADFYAAQLRAAWMAPASSADTVNRVGSES